MNTVNILMMYLSYTRHAMRFVISESVQCCCWLDEWTCKIFGVSRW